MRIKLIADTNILLKYNQELDTLLSIKTNFELFLLIPRIIIEELDNLKAVKFEARNTTRFIDRHLETLSVVIEGQNSLGKMEIDEMIPDEINTLSSGSNDDKILRFVFDHRDSIFLTNDKIIALKAKSFGFNYLLIDSFDVMQILNIIEYYSFNGTLEYEVDLTHELNYEDYSLDTELRDMIPEYERDEAAERRTFVVIMNVLKSITDNNSNVLRGFKNAKPDNLHDLLDYCIKNFNSLRVYLSNDAKEDLMNIKNCILHKINIKSNCKRLLIVFGQTHIDID